MPDKYRIRRIVIAFFAFIMFAFLITTNTPIQSATHKSSKKISVTNTAIVAIDELNKIVIKGRAPKTDYSREQFGAGWVKNGGCDTRNVILNRDLINVIVDDKCNVASGILNDPYTGKIIKFLRGSNSSGAVQIDHVVALSDAWQKGAQNFTLDKRINLANDPIELLAVDGAANLQKSDGDAATWLPPNKSFRCQYVARQIAVKLKYNLWMTRAEHDVIETILDKCPEQLLPSP